MDSFDKDWLKLMCGAAASHALRSYDFVFIMSDESEGDALMIKARKAHTKTLLNWSADWGAALLYYEQAIAAYRKDSSVKSQTKMIEALKQAAGAAEELSNVNAAAKHLTTAAAVALKLGDKVSVSWIMM